MVAVSGMLGHCFEGPVVCVVSYGWLVVCGGQWYVEVSGMRGQWYVVVSALWGQWYGIFEVSGILEVSGIFEVSSMCNQW